MNDLLQLMHDTMNPVYAIKGAVELLRTANLTANERRILEGIAERADHINKILDAYYTKAKDSERSKRLDV